MLYPANVNHLAKYLVPSNQQELALALSSELKPARLPALQLLPAAEK